ncbi:N-6 DNA methylase [Kordia sp. YSTF-M3]|uniref:site-specific DNA-methyltransferase (adenine-specific) n=1 Tax=Kordia aestuariivivens TaxID=2759037 RepID=A0ABR7QBR4_9FLAO|nr:N-6 DNA methylase [Kordia aestuariivivens]MBC8755994.1 N-6 DNA methylase [Kordia aestuariivivens]
MMLLKDSYHLELEELFERHLYSSIETVKKHYLNHLIQVFVDINNDFIEEKGIELFEYILAENFNYRDQYADALQPDAITKIMNHFVPKTEKYSFYNPFAGLASLAIDLPKNVEYVGEEKNSVIQVLGKMRLLMYNRPANFIFEQKDSLQSFYDDKKYDFVAFNPPFHFRVKSDHHENKYFSRSNANAFIISECFKKLKEGGKMVFLTPNGFLFRRNQKEVALKKFLVDNQYLESIIALPSSILNFSSIPVNIITLSKEKSPRSSVRFIDATDMFTTSKMKRNIVDAEKVITLIDEYAKNEFVQDVSFKEIAKNDYNLSVNRYVFEELQIPEVSN